MVVFSLQRALIYSWLFASFYTLLVQCSAHPGHPGHIKYQTPAVHSSHTYKRQNASNDAVIQAQKILDQAMAQQNMYNEYRFNNPKRNTYVSKHSNAATAVKRRRAAAPPAPALNATVLAAAKLIAEHNAAAEKANGTLHRNYAQPQHLGRSVAPSNNNTKREYRNPPYGHSSSGQPYWVAQIAQTGHAPMGYDDSYKVFRSVKDPLFGAKGDGVNDDTDAINKAIAYQGSCLEGCESSSVKGTLIYFPAGTYLISSPINASYYSQLVGDPNNLPIIKTSQQFLGLGAIQSDVYIPNANGDEWYIEQSNFYRQVRNFIIDVSGTVTARAAGLHWQVAQATSMTNVRIQMSTAANNTQMGMFTENGSGGFMSDCFIFGGKYGIYGGNQQYTVRNFEFSSQTTAGICLLWDWGWTWSGLTFAGMPTGILLIPPPEENSKSTPGSIYVMDTMFNGVSTAIDARAMNHAVLDSSIITLDNIAALNVQTMVAFEDGEKLYFPSENNNFIVIGNVGTDGATGKYTASVTVPSDSLLDLDFVPAFRHNYFGKSRPQYEGLGTGSIISVKDYGAVGNGVADDTAAIKKALAQATTSNLIYFPAGSYLVTSTITISPHTRITGQVWSQIVASGSFFANASHPQVMVQVGASGDVGTVEISDMLFTSVGALPGLIMMEWNVQAASQGSVGMWDAHFRVGGAYGSQLQVAQCPPQPVIPNRCVAAAMMMHITSGSNGYFENVWAWVADHDIDDAKNTQVTVAVARGILIESQGPTWLYGTASEHSMLYQYNFYGTTNTFAGMIQTESPYFQYASATESPGPFAVGTNGTNLFNNDPSFPDSPNTCNGTDLLCNFSWAVILGGVNNLTIAGAGLYSWFDAYDQSVCVDAQNCQQRLVNDQGTNLGLWIWNLITIGSVEMISDTFNQKAIFAKENTQLDSHPYWSALAAYANDSEGDSDGCDDEDTDPKCMASKLCDYTRSFNSLAAIQAASATMNGVCASYYALQVLSDMLDTEVQNYTDVNAGYDDVFGDYVSYIKEMVPDALGKFVAISTASLPLGGPGQKYFDCAYQSGKLSVKQQCPISWKTIAQGAKTAATLTYTLRDKDGFFGELNSRYGIQESWVKFQTNFVHTPCGGRGICVQSDVTYVGAPTTVDNFTPTNPKDVVASAIPNIDSMQDTIAARQIDASTGNWPNGTGDVVEVVSMPAFIISQALQSMAQVKAIGEEEAKRKKIALITEILSIVLAFIPFLPELAPASVAIRGAVEIVSAAGNIGLTVQSIVADPASAPYAILGALSFGRAKTSKDYANLAAAKKAISDEDLGKIGTTFKASETELKNTLTHSCFMEK